MAVAVSALFKDRAGIPNFKVAGLLWGAWIAWYSFLAFVQAGALGTIALTGSVSKVRPLWMGTFLAYVIAFMVLMFTSGAIYIFSTSFELLMKH